MERATVACYERDADRWERLRPADRLDAAARFARDVAPGAMRADLGCGPGFHAPALGRPLVLLDAAFAMVARARDRTRHALAVQADLAALPFARARLGGAWASKSYLHVARAALPLALADLHRALVVGAPAWLRLVRGANEGVKSSGDFPGRFFCEWEPEPLARVVAGAGFDVERLDAGPEWLDVRARRARSLPDTVGAGMHLLVCGLNPSEYAADAGVGFARPGNRFWPAARAAGLVTRDRDPRHALVHHGMGMTDLVKRATARADTITAGEYRAGAARVEALVRWLEPRTVAFVGLAGYRAAVDRPAAPGWQPRPFGGRPCYVMPSTSGANAHARLDELVAHLRRAAGDPP